MERRRRAQTATPTTEIEQDAERCAASLMTFVRGAWSVLEPATPFVHGWVLDCVAEHLEAVSRGEIQNIIINIPPGTMKSLLCGVFWPTWEWARRPTRRFLTASYAQPLATRDALKSRRLIQSTWYQERFGRVFSLADDQNQKTRYDNNKMGFRLALSVGGAVTGERGDIRILDDPHHAQDIKSDAIRENSIEWIKTVWPTRKMSSASAEVVIMQRLHERDATGFLLSEIGDYEHLCLPMHWDGAQRFTVLGNYDKRSEPGQLLFPERFDEKEVTRLELLLGSDASGQLEQRPTSAEGGIFQKSIWDDKNRYDSGSESIRNRVFARWLTFDTALKDKSSNDPSACCVWELWPDYRLAVREMWEERVNSALLPAKIETLARKWNVDGKLRSIVIEDKGSGTTAIQTLRMSAEPWLAEKLAEFQPQGDKPFRAKLASVWCERNLIQLPHPGLSNAEWYTKFLDPEKGQLWMFPNVAHDDLVDTFSMGILYLENYLAEGWRARQSKQNGNTDRGI